MTADKANELVEIVNGIASPEARLAAWLWIEDVINEAVAEERERCAKVADNLYAKGPNVKTPQAYVQAWGSGVLDAAAAIREVKS